jgi:hypothetical protein
MKVAINFSFTLFCMGAVTGIAGCGTERSIPGSEQGTGLVELSLSTVPADAACLRVTAAGSRTVTRLFGLTPGTAPTLTIDRLPIGVVVIDAQAFGGGCAGVGPITVPSWVAETPFSAHIDPLIAATVVLNLIRNGRASVSIDFESPPWISSSRTPADLAIIGDTPYGPLQIPDFPNLIAAINAAPALTEIVHLGDIKNGSSRCDTSYFQLVRGTFDQVGAPLRLHAG